MSRFSETSHWRDPATSRRRHCHPKPWRYRPSLEGLEVRLVLTSDFGDAPLPYKTLLAEGGAEHVATGPTLGANRDVEASGAHSAAADADDLTGIPDDEDGVALGNLRAGEV